MECLHNLRPYIFTSKTVTDFQQIVILLQVFTVNKQKLLRDLYSSTYDTVLMACHNLAMMFAEETSKQLVQKKIFN